MTRKVNWMLPGLVTVDWHKKQRAKAIRKLNPMILQQTLCMVYHMLQWCTSGAAGHLPRNPRKVREEGCRKRRNPPLQAPSFSTCALFEARFHCKNTSKSVDPPKVKKCHFLRFDLF